MKKTEDTTVLEEPRNTFDDGMGWGITWGCFIQCLGQAIACVTVA
jgi:hypothetical protein